MGSAKMLNDVSINLLLLKVTFRYFFNIILFWFIYLKREWTPLNRFVWSPWKKLVLKIRKYQSTIGYMYTCSIFLHVTS